MDTQQQMTAENASYANLIGYTDIIPFEIVCRISAKCLEVRAMNAQLCADFKPEFIIGGFAGHCVNNYQQRYEYSANVENKTIRIRLSVRKGCRPMWRDADGSEYRLAMQPVKHYDYNF